MSTKTDVLWVQRDPDGFLTLTLHRPEKLNALNPDLLAALKQAVEDANNAGDLNGIILQGSGENFCAGGDIFNMREAVDTQDIHALSPFLALLEETAASLYTSRLPTLCILDGIVAGAGLGLALACDLRVATTRTQCHLAFPTLGAIPDAASSYLLPHVIGYPRAMEFYIRNTPLDAETGRAWGLFHELTPREKLSECIRLWKEKMRQLHLRGFHLTKTLFQQALSHDLTSQVQAEYFGQLTAMTSEHFARMVTALTSKGKKQTS
jgi:2-(1,2-epoxy-1,2-dihydrophenyl)acetyl-CoA isomerase